MRHSAPELPSICAVTMSSGLYWLMNCMASYVEHASVRASGYLFPASPPTPRDTVRGTYWVGVKLLGQLLIGLLRERHYRRLLGAHGEQRLGMGWMHGQQGTTPACKEWVCPRQWGNGQAGGWLLTS